MVEAISKQMSMLSYYLPVSLVVTVLPTTVDLSSGTVYLMNNKNDLDAVEKGE